MNIQEFSRLSGISAHTLRYYEKIGIFHPVNRNASGHRDYCDKDILWAEFIKRLKETGMVLRQIKYYADLRSEGDSTVYTRMELLKNHANELKKKIAQEKHHLQKINEKISFYETAITRKVSLDLE